MLVRFPQAMRQDAPQSLLLARLGVRVPLPVAQRLAQFQGLARLPVVLLPVLP